MKKIAHFYQQIKNISSLSPCTETNKFFDKLCHYSITSDEIFKDSPKVKFIRQQAWIAEWLLEKYYAQKYIQENTNKNEILKDFPYIKNYDQLTNLEVANIQVFLAKFKNILFIWAGALPISVILLAQNHWCKFTIIDKDKEATKFSYKIIQKLWLEKSIKIQNKDILEYKNNDQFDVVYCTSLLFGEKNNNKILQTIHKNINSKLYLFRSAEWMRQILYKKLDTKLIQKYFDIQIELHPKNEIINSIILCTKKQYVKGK